jgi:hypothetical protein
MVTWSTCRAVSPGMPVMSVSTRWPFGPNIEFIGVDRRPWRSPATSCRWPRTLAVRPGLGRYLAQT